jgi:hypothetical protein
MEDERRRWAMGIGQGGDIIVELLEEAIQQPTNGGGGR